MTLDVVVHLAGEPEGLVQKCSRCGYVLLDLNGAMFCGGGDGPGWWEGPVEVIEGFPMRFRVTTGEPDCSLGIN